MAIVYYFQGGLVEILSKVCQIQIKKYVPVSHFPLISTHKLHLQCVTTGFTSSLIRIATNNHNGLCIIHLEVNLNLWEDKGKQETQLLRIYCLQGFNTLYRNVNFPHTRTATSCKSLCRDILMNTCIIMTGPGAILSCYIIICGKA